MMGMLLHDAPEKVGEHICYIIMTYIVAVYGKIQRTDNGTNIQTMGEVMSR